ncbi:signal transduction histidine kinase LytS [Sporocytophaga myxococcoides]|uniref:Signal transduction histidine kinase LytS n=1 Tax=Sporocytophaga myxococcoides TaxID=153721 RepID=A0A098LII6_9BACT|nr:histidine kinase [Sporocytophaga myxococcoides]GAL85988.1 signal transduction histidine kinase LytS [Sporocytophaga myxococcoides]
MRAVLILCSVLLITFWSYAQYPQYIAYDNESSLPSNEVYSILQDQNGFIWIGCGAGLYKFNGIRYIPYRSDLQKSRSITGLTLSSSGTLYCFNFKSQTFYIEGDSLKELVNPGLVDIINLTSDAKGNIYASHLDGISSYNEKNKEWKLIYQSDKTSKQDKNRPVAKASRISNQGELFFISPEGIGKQNYTGVHLFEHPYFNTASPRKHDLVVYNDTLWIFSKDGNIIYLYAGDTLEILRSKKIRSLLYNRKINAVRALDDGKLWICTYKGLISYDLRKDSSALYYPEIAFSDCIRDRDGNYWFTTLQEGILRVPNLSFLVWNKEYGLFSNDRLSKIVTDKNYIYFTSTSGMLGKLNVFNHTLKTYNTGISADIQSLDFDFNERTLWFNQNNHMFGLKDEKLKSSISQVEAIKVRYRIGEDIFLASSHGTYLNNILLNNSWARDIVHAKNAGQIWVASNDGLLQLDKNRRKWAVNDTLLAGHQIIAIDADTLHQQLFLITFNGSVFQVDKDKLVDSIAHLPQGVLAVKIKYYENCLYVATNQGLWSFDLNILKWKSLNVLSGIASDNIQDLLIVNNIIWLCTGKGLQMMPIEERNDRIEASAKVYLQKVIIDEEVTSNYLNLKLKFGQPLVLYPEAVLYRCQGKFQYAYRIKNIDTSWVILPGNIDKIELQNIPSGSFIVELKVLDCFDGNSSEHIVLQGYINPPFWRTWWFTLLLLLIFSIGAILFLKYRIQQLKRRQQKEIERIHLENELRVAQQSALIAQMNPHFIFNVLNSIKSYIYRNDKEKALIYLDDFSHLVRTVLEMSSVQYTSLGNELKILRLYIDLEAMMVAEDFTCLFNVDETLDLNHLKFPTLLLQPFIENSFKHGFRAKKGTKRLTLSVRETENDTLLIQISDNGIGRKKAEELKSQNQYKKQSFATSAIQHRIDLINREGVLKINVETEDLQDKDGSAMGTNINITLMYKQ